MLRMPSRSWAVATALALAACALPGVARASLTLSFAKINSNTENNADISGQLSATVFTSADNNSANLGTSGTYGANLAANQGLFVFKNNVGVASSITDIYFQDGTLLGIASIRVSSSSGVAFSEVGVSPAELPGANNLNPAFVTKTDQTNTNHFSADADNNPKGVNTSSEWVGILFNLQTGNTGTSLLAALNNWAFNPNSAPDANGKDTRWSKVDATAKSVRVGIHVTGIGSGNGSDAYVNFVPNLAPVPEPATLVLAAGLLPVVGLVVLRRRNKKSADVS